VDYATGEPLFSLSTKNNISSKVPISINWEVTCDGWKNSGSLKDEKDKMKQFYRKGEVIRAGLFSICDNYQRCTSTIILEGDFLELLATNGSLEIYNYRSLYACGDKRSEFAKFLITLLEWPWRLYYLIGGPEQITVWILFGLVILGLILIVHLQKRGNKK
jgi:hypothetical protein